MVFRMSRILFPRSLMVELNATRNKSIVLKTYNQPNVDQLGGCAVKIRHNDKC